MSKKNKRTIFGGIRHMAIAKKITLLYGGIFSFSLFIISLFMTLNITAIQQHNIRRELTYTISNIDVYVKQGKQLSNEALRGLLDNKYVEVCVYDQEDDCFYYSHFGEGPSLIQSQEFNLQSYDGHLVKGDELTEKRKKAFEEDGFKISVQKESAGNSTEYILENSKNQQLMLISSTIPTKEGIYRVEAFKLIDINSNFLKGFIVKLAMIDFIGIFCAFLIGRYISRRMLQPVEAIRSAAERITIEDLSQRIDTDGPEDEMKELTVTFNSMIDRLESSFQRQNQFVSDASHELRTPISVIQGYANLINRWGKSDPDILQESIDSILSETDHMSALIRKLLFLAKGDQNRMLVQKQLVTLNEIANEIVKELEILEVNRQVLFDEKDKAEIWGDPDLIKQLLWIHAENALKYTKDGDLITIRVWKDKKNAYVSVGDNGAGISKEHLPKIFDRFYRVDQSRNKGISGTGLGLSIAKWIVDSHFGQVSVESEEGKGTTFTNAFPLNTRLKKDELKKDN
ncbi:sensor histidine kinase [Anaerotignum sp.]|uniref:sensor histidine kinase n=1 Tax=Anaerotignum sp. TaxID=2039241 RepID=UPI0028A6CABA|nr:ATP-binding protein [Anaerotignum sp.]